MTSVAASQVDYAMARGPSLDFTALVHQHQSMVYSLALHFLRDPEAAQELAQEVFLQLHRSIGGLASEAHALHWLRQVTSRRCIDSIRRTKARLETSLEDTHEPASPPAVGDPLLSAKLRKLVASLPADIRMVMVLRFQEDLEAHEIARVMELPIRTVRNHMHKALELLRRKAAVYLGEV